MPDNAETVERLLSFCYTGDYCSTGRLLDSSHTSTQMELDGNFEQPPGPDANSTSNQGKCHLDVFRLAERHQIEPLQRLAIQRLEDWCFSHWETTEFYDIVHDIMDTSPERNSPVFSTICNVISQHLRSLWCRDNMQSIFVKHGLLLTTIWAISEYRLKDSSG
ncbi:uncharacterized protein BDV14DRAFT_75882 [Aspergillus stella-maris]|uniref:uncharacterized protein n=1 Tax=Aspergillus stella-maris TaxID=1810926 RepID=UPI003CCE2720